MANHPEHNPRNRSTESFIDQLIVKNLLQKIRSIVRSFDEVIIGELIDMLEFPAELIFKLFEEKLTDHENYLITKVADAVKETFESSDLQTINLKQIIFNRPNLFTLIVDDEQHYFSFDQKDDPRAIKRQTMARVAISRKLGVAGSSNQASIQVMSEADVQEIGKRTRGIKQAISSDETQRKLNKLFVNLRLGKVVYSADKS